MTPRAQNKAVALNGFMKLSSVCPIALGVTFAETITLIGENVQI
jgi:hypothetical protein